MCTVPHGLGNNPRFGVKVAEAVAPEKILYYIKAMWLTFRAYGNYENRGKARSRYMQETLGGPEAYAKAFREKLAEVEASGENLDLTVEIPAVSKEGDGVVVDGPGHCTKAAGPVCGSLASHRRPGGQAGVL